MGAIRLLAGLGLLATLLAGALLACTGGLVRSGERFAHPRLGGSIVDLAALDPTFSRIDVEGATLAYRGPGGTLAAWVRECRGAGDPARLAQALLFEWDAQPIGQSAREVHGAPGVDLRAKNADAWLHAVTRAGPACSDDWILVTRGPAGEQASLHDPLLERWVASFDPHDEGRPGE